jgi:hypothetical protein
MFRATFCPSLGALFNCSRSLRFPYRSQVDVFLAVVCLLVTNEHFIIFLKTALFNDDAVKTSNPTKYYSFQLVLYLHV